MSHQQAQDLVDAQVSMAEETMPSSTALSQVTQGLMPVVGVPGHSQSPQVASFPAAAIASLPVGESNEASFSNLEDDLEDVQSWLQDMISIKVADLVPFLLLKYETKEPFSKAEMIESVIGIYQGCYDEIFRKARKGIRLVFGLDVKEVDPVGHTYILVTALGLTYDGMESDVQGVPKTGLLIIVLGVIALEGSPVSEEVVWDVLHLMGVHASEDHYISGNPKKLITEEFVQEGYLRYRQVPYTCPALYEFRWGSRARAETSEARVLQFLANIGNFLPSHE